MYSLQNNQGFDNQSNSRSRATKRERTTSAEHDEIVMGSVGMLGMGGVVSDPNVSLPATETYASNANPVPH